MRAHRALIISVLMLALAAPASAIAAKRIIEGGSTSVLPLAEKLAAAYHKAFPTRAYPEVGGVSPTAVSRARLPADSTSATPRATRSRASIPKASPSRRSRATASA